MTPTRLALTLGIAAALGASLAPPAGAVPQTSELLAPLATIAVFVNTTRAAYCTDEMLAWELAEYAWYQVPDNPDPEPVSPPSTGLKAGTATYTEVRPGVVVYKLAVTGATAELWPFDSRISTWDDLGAGPCMDTTEASGRSATGTSTWRESDNDLLGYEVDGRRTRGDAFRTQITATVSGAAGTLMWTGDFHNRITPDGDYRFAGGERVVTTR